MGRGEYARKVAARSDICDPSPSGGLDDSFAGIGKLVSHEVSGRQLVLPLLGRAAGRPTLQRTSSRSTGRIDDANRNPLACSADRECEIAVVRHDDGRIDVAQQRVNEQVAGDIHVGALLFPIGDGDHEHRVWNIAPGCVLDNDGMARCHDDGPPLPVRQRNRSRLHLLEELAVLDPVDGRRSGLAPSDTSLAAYSRSDQLER